MALNKVVGYEGVVNFNDRQKNKTPVINLFKRTIAAVKKGTPIA